MTAMSARYDDLARAAARRQLRRTTSTDADLEAAVAAPLGVIRMNDATGGGHRPDQRAVATVLRLQRSVGNQAVQRLLQRDDDPFPTPTIGDWKIEPPKPTTETDDTYDTDENRKRANQNAEDERGESPKPEWWKPRPHGKATDPKDWDDLNKWRGKEKPSDGGTDFGPLPPAEEPQPGDYPLTPAIEPEDAVYA
jgi:hypothetical protein